jgi:hypothetical protein
MLFKFGRLVELFSPEGGKYEFSILRDGTRTITYSGKVILSIRREFNNTSLFFDYHVVYTNGGKRHTAILKMGERPVMQAMTFFDANDRPVTRDQQRNTNTLRAIQIDGAPEKRFDYELSKLQLSGAENQYYIWDKKSNVLTEELKYTYSHPIIQGVPCLKRTFRNGTSILSGRDSKQGIEIIKTLDSKKILRIDSFPWSQGKIMYQKIKARYEVSEGGYATLLEKHLYDENGMLIREIRADEIISYSGNDVISRGRRNNEILWAKLFDKKGRIREFQDGGRIYSFNYIGDDAEVSVLKSDRSVLSRALVPAGDVLKTFSTQTRGN